MKPVKNQAYLSASWRVTASIIRLPISAVEIAGPSWLPDLMFAHLRTNTSMTALSIHPASHWNECCNIIAAYKIAPAGFAMFLPAISGADP